MIANMSTSILIDALDYCYESLRLRYPDARPAVFVIYHSFKKWGSIWFNSWSVPGLKSQADKPPWEKQTAVDEIHINSELFSLGATRILATLLHETAHSIARGRHIKDTSRGNRYHNKEFAKIALELGLQVDHHPTFGYFTPDVSHLVYDRHTLLIYKLAEACVMYQSFIPDTATGTGTGNGNTPTAPTKRPPREKSRQLKAICQCEPARIVRLSQSVYDAGSILCGLCSSNFELN